MTASAPKPCKIAALVGASAVAIAVLALLTWIGGELHYRNCLTSAELRYPVAYQQGEPGSGRNSYLRAAQGGSFVFYERENRNEAIAGCSRWP